MSNVLEVRGLTAQRGGRTVLNGVDLVVPAGSIVAMLGANGAGKSSLVMTLAGLIDGAKGEVSLEGKRIDGLTPLERRRAGLAIVAEGHQVLPGVTVHDNIAAAALSLPRALAAERIEEAVEMFPELRERMSVEAQRLSGGQKQMVNIAQALVIRPKVLLVDELSLGLAPAVVQRLGNMLRDIAAQGVGVLLIEQFTTLALSLAQTAYVMERGNLIFSGTSQALRDDPSILHGAYLASGTH
jgi:branched-chain amino acid transport system ATP-binding protein